MKEDVYTHQSNIARNKAFWKNCIEDPSLMTSTPVVYSIIPSTYKPPPPSDLPAVVPPSITFVVPELDDVADPIPQPKIESTDDQPAEVKVDIQEVVKAQEDVSDTKVSQDPAVQVESSIPPEPKDTPLSSD